MLLPPPLLAVADDFLGGQKAVTDAEGLMLSLARNSPPENYVVTPHRKRRPGFQNSPAQNTAFVPLSLSMCPPAVPASYGLEDVLSLSLARQQHRAAHPSHLPPQPHPSHHPLSLSVLSLPMAASPPPLDR